MNDLKVNMKNWRHDIHRYPELGFHEMRTAQMVVKILKSLGIQTYDAIGKTGVVGMLKRGSSDKAIGLRADMDALPIQEMSSIDHKSQIDHVFHGCGHDGHMAMLLGAAKYLTQNDDFDGIVYFIFQPSEEDGRGALAMMEDGLFERFPMDAIYGIHNMPGIAKGEIAVKSGQMMTSEDNFIIKINGKGGHSSMPHMTRDPMVVGAQIVTALQTIISRTLGPNEWGVVSITEFNSDGARNIIPSNVTIKGDVRALDIKVQDKIEKHMRQIVKGICDSHNVTGDVDYSHEFIVLDNWENETKAAISAAKATVGVDAVNSNCQTCACSEDFAQFLKHIPGAFILLGSGNGADEPPLHNPYYDFNDELLTIGCDYWVNLVQQQLA